MEQMTCTTENYDTFKIENLNRYDRNSIRTSKYFQKLKNSIKKDGQMEAISVLDDMTVVNGQTRLEALIELSLPVKYVVLEGNFEDAMRRMRILGKIVKGWSSIDTANSWTRENSEYGKLIDIYERTGVNIKEMATLSTLTRSTFYISDNFDNGKLKNVDYAGLLKYCQIQNTLISTKGISSKNITAHLIVWLYSGKFSSSYTEELVRKLELGLNMRKGNKIRANEAADKLTNILKSRGGVRLSTPFTVDVPHRIHQR